METAKGSIKQAWPYQKDKMNLPVADVEAALPFYETRMGFRVVTRHDIPYQSAILDRDGIQIGLAENGGEPTQDGCFFEVDDVETAFAELKANGLTKELSDFSRQKYGETEWNVFFVVAPDGLCYCYGQRPN
ncbi:VOC family protein [Nibrella viscosa]|uniref:VOC family protein n=1 Tax=Nibrella viscosa TaxID=1084524 RepID=A0ABP8JT73_9BACT